MVKSNEIRKGNYHEGVDFSVPRMGISSRKINGIVPHAITAYGIYMVDEGKLEFKPILITEEWLIEFGFTNEPFNAFYIGKYINGNYFTLYTEDRVNYYFFYESDGIKMKRKIEYVHQLQNLFFDITAQELTLKYNGK